MPRRIRRSWNRLINNDHVMRLVTSADHERSSLSVSSRFRSCNCTQTDTRSRKKRSDSLELYHGNPHPTFAHPHNLSTAGRHPSCATSYASWAAAAASSSMPRRMADHGNRPRIFAKVFICRRALFLSTTEICTEMRPGFVSVHSINTFCLTHDNNL